MVMRIGIAPGIGSVEPLDESRRALESEDAWFGEATSAGTSATRRGPHAELGSVTRDLRRGIHTYGHH